MSLRRSISSPLFSAVRSTLRPSPSPSVRPRRLPISSSPRSVGVLGAAVSLLPLHSVVASHRLNSHLPACGGACCGLRLPKGTCKDP